VEIKEKLTTLKKNYEAQDLQQKFAKEIEGGTPSIEKTNPTTLYQNENLQETNMKQQSKTSTNNITDTYLA
jgi:hypothetical protein